MPNLPNCSKGDSNIYTYKYIYSNPPCYSYIQLYIYIYMYMYMYMYIYIHSHYVILSDIMIILDHGNIICVDTFFMIIIMHSFPDIEEKLFFDNGGPHLRTHNMHIILQHFK